MPARKQLLVTLRNGNPDRAVVMPIVYGLAAGIAQAPLHRYLTDAQTLAQCQQLAASLFDYDAVFAYTDNAVDAEAFGATLDWQEGFYPRILKPVIQSAQIPDLLFQLRPNAGGRREAVLQACGILSGQQEKLVVGTVFGPLSLAGQLMGLERMVLIAVDQPDLFQQVLDYLRPFVDDYASALAASGADILVLYEPAASPVIINGKIFSKHLYPLYQAMLRRWSDFGVLVWLHIIGPLRRFLPLLTGLSFNLLTVDSGVAWKQARELFPTAWLVGNLPAPAFALDTAEKIEDKVKKFVQDSDSRSVIGADCELPLDTRLDNLRVLVRSGREREG